MPNLDGTGPNGQGPMTGRGLGPYCCGIRGFCKGRGLGFRRFFSFKSDLASLEEQEKILEEELKIIRKEKDELNLKR